MSKICTSLEQSKKFLELGIDVNTADMHYWLAWRGGVSNEVKNTPKIGIPNNIHRRYWIPAWSLAALLKVLPDTITSNDGIAFKLNIKKNIIEYSNPSLYLIYKSVKSGNPIDACIKMIIKLHEQKLL